MKQHDISMYRPHEVEQRVKTAVVYIFVSLVVAALMLIFVSVWATVPIVEYSYETDECVEVIDFDPKPPHYSCENLPNKHTARWVE